MRAARPASGSLADCPLLATRPGWHGPLHRGHAACVKAAKREEARRRKLPGGKP